ncbi:DUF1631 family protein [Thiocystis violascens]|uniref:Diguanylate cyclase (GGDEF) domain-containing protein n=1 Tax=Thiocystis violascens (strain ATCC 17096 / DSM 198 / 6111) TaxID=765911 RepID=I3Y8L9_THIV6|nr:DUF1631 family protein [Thiocystis violascens]AFL73337.1 diguanylate cyclase (GGDEF) domain-containing protein [Thiocystis violascens DSM 198]
MTEPPRSSRERRIQTRHPVDLHAKVRGRNQLPTNCRVLNLCNGGLLLDTSATEPALPFVSGEHVDLHFDLPDAQSMDPVQAVVEIVHRVDRGLGARFIRLEGDGRARLARFIGEAAAASQPATEIEPHPGRLQAREVLRDVGQRNLGGLLDSLLETLVEDLWSHSERAMSDAERARLTGEIGLLARAVQDESIPRRIRQEWLDALQNLGQARATPAASAGAAPSADGLQLIDPDEFEIWLAKSELANRLEEELREPLDALRAQLSAIFQETALPMEPLALAEAIEQALSEVGVGKELQKISMRMIANHLSSNLGAFYREVSRAWASSGLADIETSPRTTGTDASTADASGYAADVPDSASPLDRVTTAPVGAAFQPAPSEAIQGARAVGLMADSLARSPVALAGRTRPARNYAGGRRVTDLLSQLPVDFQLPEADANRPLRELLAQWLRSAEPNQKESHPEPQPVLSPQVEERVEVTDRLLSHMLADPATPARIKSLIKPLSRRFLSMAIAEPGAMADASQPLVNLINHLEQLSLYLLNQEGDDRGLRREFEDVAQTLVSSEARDPAALDALSKRLGSIESKAGREYQGNVVNWVTVCEAKERERLAREQVRERLNGALGGRRIHQVVDEFIQTGWRNLLELACANGGLEGSRWRQYWRLLASLHRMTGGEGAAEDPEPISLAAMIAEIRTGLSYIGVDAIPCDELLGRIETAVRRARASLSRDEDFLIFSPLAADADSEPERIPTDLPAADWERGLAQVNALPLGALLWMRTKDDSKALRLIWRNEEGSRLAIADTLGKKVKVLPRQRLAEAFARAQAHAEAPTAKRAVTRAADAALTEMQERLVYHETQDPLTGLSNQRRLLGSLTQLLLSDDASASAHALAFLELDRYDTLTGTFGYSAGERILVAVAKLLENVVPDAVCLAYLGGCRFGLLMPAIDRDHASEIGEAIRAGLTAMPNDLQGKPFRLAGSLGMVMLDGDATTPEQLMSAASVACLASHREGGDRVILFREDNEIVVRQLDHLRDWAQAEEIIASRRHRLRYQRIVPIDPSSELTPHCEILLSVYDEQGAPLPLQPFILAAEAFNRMREVDRQVIETALRWINAHPDQARELGGIAINLSGQSLSDPDLLTFIRASLKGLQVPVDLISFEVTETVAIVNLDQAAIILGEIKALGCRVALDDFGSGMSSYSYLKQLPVDYVKIDGSFVKDILISPHDRQIVKSFNEIAHFMGKKTIAEYVENLEILELLQDIGVDYAQGYAIERPQFLDEMP